MPTYVYEREDGSSFEIEQRITEDALETCPITGQKVKRVITATAFSLKGSGWYKSDYGSSGSKSESKKEDTKSDSSSGGACSHGAKKCGCS